MSEKPNGILETGQATNVSLLTKARRLFGGTVAFGGGAVAYVGLEGNNIPVAAGGAAIVFLGALLAGIGWIRGEKE